MRVLHASGCFVALLDAMKSYAVSKISIADCDIGPKGLMTSAPLISVIAVLSEVDLENNRAIEVAELEALRKPHPNIKFTM